MTYRRVIRRGTFELAQELAIILSFANEVTGQELYQAVAEAEVYGKYFENICSR